MEKRPSDRWQRIRILAAVAGILLVVGIWFWLGSGDSPSMTARDASLPTHEEPSSSDEKAPVPEPQASNPRVEEAAVVPTSPPAIEATVATRDEELKTQFVGVWFHSENGEQWIENRTDGTSRMLLKLDFISSLLYGKKTEMELKWDVKDGLLSHTMVSGSPQENVDRLVKDFGETREYAILEMTPKRMLLESKNEKKKKDLWTRMPAPQEWEVQTPKAENPDSASPQ